VTGLRVADASVMPEITTVNRNITAMLVGERCADFLKVERAARR
jgi:choline oxidase